MSRTADKDKKKDKGVQKRTTDKDKLANSPPSSPHIDLKKSRKQRADIVRTPIFGNTLADEIARSQARFGKELLVPDFLYFSAKFLESLGLNQVGLFRIAGEKNACNALKDKLVDGFDYTFEGESEHTVCTLFKQYLRSLPVPLCTFDYFDEFCYLSKCDDDDERISHIQEYINDTIPKENAVALKFVIRFLKKVGENSSKNQMTVSNLSSMIAPNILFREKEIQSKMLSDTKDSNFCVEFLINQYDKVFKQIPDQKEFEIVDLFLEPEKVESGAVKEKRDKPPKRQSTKDDKHKDKTDREKDRAKSELTDSNASVTTADSPKVSQATGDDAAPQDSPSAGKLARNPTSPRRQHSKGDRGDKVSKLKNSDAATVAETKAVEKPAEPAPEIENAAVAEIAVTPVVEQPRPEPVQPEPTPDPTPKVEAVISSPVTPTPVIPEPEPKKAEPEAVQQPAVVAKPVEEPKKVEKAPSVNVATPTSVNAVKSPRTPKDNNNANANATKPAVTQQAQPQPVTSTKSLNPPSNNATATPSPTQPVVEAKPPSSNGASNNSTAPSGGPAQTSTQLQFQKDKDKEKEVLANLPRTASLIERFQQFQKDPEQPEIKHVNPPHATNLPVTTTSAKFGGGASTTNAGNTSHRSLNVPTPTPTANASSNGANSASNAALTPRALDRINQYQSHAQDKAQPVLNVDNPVGQAEEEERISKDKFNQLRAMFNQVDKKDEEEEERLKREKFNQLRAMFNK